MSFNVMRGKGQDAIAKFGKAAFPCYSEKKLKKLYPHGGYDVVGEVMGRNKQPKVDELNPGGYVISKLGSNSRLFNRVAGYIRVGEDRYVLALAPRIRLLLASIATLLAAAATAVLLILNPGWLQAPTVIEPLPDIQAIEGDDGVKPDVEEGGGSVTLTYSLGATISLSEETVSVFYQNPNSSTHDIELELYLVSDGEQTLVARSDRVGAGYALNWMELTGNVVLSEGTYTGTYRVVCYDPETGEQATITPEIPGVAVTVTR